MGATARALADHAPSWQHSSTTFEPGDLRYLLPSRDSWESTL
jgi:hypothetical protein